MALRREPTARQMRLAAELRRLREAAGLTAREAAALLGVSPAQISQIESGLAGVSEERLRRLASHYACTDEDFIDALVAMATDRTRGWWEEYRGLLPTSFLDLAELEHHATFRPTWRSCSCRASSRRRTTPVPSSLPGFPNSPDEELELRVQHRMAGANRSPFPTRRSSTRRHCVSGSVTAPPHGLNSPALLELSEADHITLRVIPFDLDGFAGASSTMMYRRRPGAQAGHRGARRAPRHRSSSTPRLNSNTYRTRFRRVEAASLDPEQSRDFIHGLAKEL